jgi:pimeloyl-ACP methyl ester carboxylesterase
MIHVATDTVQLAFQRTGTPGNPPIVILHGFLGMADNWRSHALRLGEQYDVWCLDLRNHGRSPHTPVFDYPSMAADVARLCQENDLRNLILVGHSMGGKVAMEYLRQHSDRVSRLIVADMSPRAYTPHHEAVLAALQAVNLEQIANRAEAEAAMTRHLPDVTTVQFLLKSLARTPEGRFEWRFNLPVVARQYANIIAGIEPYPAPLALPTLFIRGGNSHYVDEPGLELAHRMFSQLQVHTLPGVGHWVHAEAPEPFLQAVLQFIAA